MLQLLWTALTSAVGRIRERVQLDEISILVQSSVVESSPFADVARSFDNEELVVEEEECRLQT